MRHGFRSRSAELVDRLRASDPGLGRLRTAAAAAGGMAAALAAEYAFATLTGTTGPARLMAMMVGAVVAMTGSMALAGTGVWRKIRDAVFFPVAVGAGLLAGAAVDQRRTVMLVGFVVVMFVAVFVRRFGLPFFFYGFMLWIGYFFASFLRVTFAMVPALLVSVAVATVTVFRTNPRTALRSTWRAYLARGRAMLRACAALVDPDPGGCDARDVQRLRRRLGARQAGVAEAGLMVEAWSEEPGALAPEWSGPALRRHAIDVQQTLDRIATASVALAGCEPELTTAAAEALDALARGLQLSGAAAVERLDSLATDGEHRDTAGGRYARRIAVAAGEYLELVQVDPEPPETEEFEEEFEPATSLMMGNLPGSPAVARDVAARGARWNPLTRLDLTSRQAVQASLAGAIAIVLGLMLSPSRYYWAVITAFVVFTGTGSRSETFLKGVSRVVGTLLGVVAAIVLGHLTNGRPAGVLVVVLVSVFLGYYLMRVSYGFLIFFLTIMLGQLYSALHQLSGGVLVLRLEETAVGAAAGIAVALLVTPVSTRDTVRTSRDNLLAALESLLTGVVGWVRADVPRPDLDALVRALDDRVRQVNLVAKPLTRPLVWGNDSRRTRHRLQLYVATAGHARMLVFGVRRARELDAAQVVDVCRALADAARRLADVVPGCAAPELTEPLVAAEEALFGAPDRESDGAVLRPLVHLQRVLADLAGVQPTLDEASRRGQTAAGR